MKRIVLATLLAAAAYVSSAAQPRAAGIRLGITNLEASYQHSVGDSFIEGDLGITASNVPGFRLTATHNVILARPSFTAEGSWNLYGGAGATLGYVQDTVKYPGQWEEYMGAMIGLVLQAGLEYNFDFPLQLSVDIRPVFGYHSNSGHTREDGVRLRHRTEFYNRGLYGLVPSVSVRYAF